MVKSALRGSLALWLAGAVVVAGCGESGGDEAEGQRQAEGSSGASAGGSKGDAGSSGAGAGSCACGDAVCDASCGESVGECPEDCGPGAMFCGNAKCDNGESGITCLFDCPPAFQCQTEPTASACAACCFGEVQGSVYPADAACACGASSPCAEACAGSKICGGSALPSDKCVACFGSLIAADGKCIYDSGFQKGCVFEGHNKECTGLAICLSQC